MQCLEGRHATFRALSDWLYETGGIHDEQGFETRCRDDKTVTSMLLGGPKGAREIPAPQGLFVQDASHAGIAGGARTPVLHTVDQKKRA